MQIVSNTLKIMYSILAIFVFILFIVNWGIIFTRLYQPTPLELQKFSNRFTMLTEKQISYPIFFNFSTDNNLGYCATFFKVPLYVTINAYNWNNLSAAGKYLLIFHETGHCSFNLDHDDTRFSDGCAKSLMNSYLPEEFCIKKHGFSYYINEFQERIEKAGR